MENPFLKFAAEHQPKRMPESEIGISFVRSSGPGGQNVNKRSTKAEMRWDLGASPFYSPEEKKLIREAAGNRLNEKGEIVIASDRLRSQSQNKEFVIEQLRQLVAEALKPRRLRQATRPTRSSQEKRILEKKRVSSKKESRRKDWE